MNRKTSFCSLGIAPPFTEASGPSSNRLAKSFFRLEEIGRRREQGRTSWLDRVTEKATVWRELLELEFQERRSKKAGPQSAPSFHKY